MRRDSDDEKVDEKSSSIRCRRGKGGSVVHVEKRRSLLFSVRKRLVRERDRDRDKDLDTVKPQKMLTTQTWTIIRLVWQSCYSAIM